MNNAAWLDTLKFTGARVMTLYHVGLLDFLRISNRLRLGDA